MFRSAYSTHFAFEAIDTNWGGKNIDFELECVPARRECDSAKEEDWS
jgi:hypothetical protein